MESVHSALEKCLYEILRLLFPGIVLVESFNQFVILRLGLLVREVQFVERLRFHDAVFVLGAFDIVMKAKSFVLAFFSFFEFEWVKPAQYGPRFINFAVAGLFAQKMAMQLPASPEFTIRLSPASPAQGHHILLAPAFQPSRVVIVDAFQLFGRQKLQEFRRFFASLLHDPAHIFRCRQADHLGATMSTTMTTEMYGVFSHGAECIPL